jgi:CBS domain-containing protein
MKSGEAAMQARDVMTAKVVTVRPDTPVTEIAKLMIDNRISGLPVVENSGRLVGIVTDGDLYRRSELGTDRRRHSWLEIFGLDTEAANDYIEAHGRTARDVMTTDVIAVAPATSLRQIADLFETKQIRRVPVVADGEVIGIVSRANLVRALASLASADSLGSLTDRRVRDLVLAEYKRLPWGLRSEEDVVVTDGVVHLWGYVPSDVELIALRVAAGAIPGVKGFKDHTFRFVGDMGIPPRNPSKVTVVEPEDGA